MIALTNTNDGKVLIYSSNRCHIHRQLPDGRVTLTLVGSRGQEEVEIKYQLLNPAPNFVEVVDEARSVVLAGGTMSPVHSLDKELIPKTNARRSRYLT
jgi:chromosome transmission fidelity protein 1